jgi:uncharacterized membrane protein
MKSFVLALSLLLLLPKVSQAHHEDFDGLSVTAKNDAVGAVHAAESAVMSGAAAVTLGAKVAPKLDWPALLKEATLTHRHNKIVHFPVALGIVGAIFLILSVRFPSFRSGARWLLFLAALSSIAAIFSGRAQTDDVETDAMKQVLQVHAALGYGVCASLWLAWMLSFVESSKKWLWFFLLLLIAAILLTGTLGGALANMQF